MSILARLIEQRPRRVNGARRDEVEYVDEPDDIDELDLLVRDPNENPRGLSREEYAAQLRRHDLAMKRLELDAASFTPPHVAARQAGAALRRWYYAAAAVGSRDEQMQAAEARLAAEALRRR